MALRYGGPSEASKMLYDSLGADDITDCPDDKITDYDKKHFVKPFAALEKNF